MFYLAATVALTLIVASLVYTYVEAPAIRLGHRLANAWERRAVRATVLPVPPPLVEPAIG